MLNKKFLVIGKGFLGTHIVSQLEKMCYSVFSTNYENNVKADFRLDILNKPSIEKLFQNTRPDIVINCVANTQIDFLEKNPDIATNINSIGTKNIAEVCSNQNCRLIHISTDNVFDGIQGMYSETDSTNPVNEYGKSKVLAEKFIEECIDNYVIIRTNFFGIDPKGRDLISQFIKTIKSKKPFFGFVDIKYTPLEIDNLSELIIETSLTKFNGLLHLASNEIISKYDLILKTAKILSLNTSLIKKGSIRELNCDAKRPMNTSLKNKKAKTLLITPILSIEDAIKKITTQISSTII